MLNASVGNKGDVVAEKFILLELEEMGLIFRVQDLISHNQVSDSDDLVALVIYRSM